MKSKKIISVIISAILAISALPIYGIMSFAESYVSGDYEYYIIDDSYIRMFFGTEAVPDIETLKGTAALNAYNGTATDITLPSEIDGYEVTMIAPEAFLGEVSESAENLRSVTIPNTVQIISGEAFHCRNLEKISIPNSVERIGGGAFKWTAFYNNESSWEDGMLYLDGWLLGVNENVRGKVAVKEKTKGLIGCAFEENKSITEVSIPDGVKEISYKAFYNCTSLTTVKLPQSLESIGGMAFSYCESLAGVELPDSLRSIGAEAFGFCDSMQEIKIPAGVTDIGEAAFGMIWGEEYPELNSDFIVKGYSGSAAEVMAKEYGIKFVALTEEDNGKAENESEDITKEKTDKKNRKENSEKDNNTTVIITTAVVTAAAVALIAGAVIAVILRKKKSE